MARTEPVNAGYAIINGSATGSNKAYVNVWLEWKQLSKDTEKNTSQVRVLLYAACTKSSSTSWTVAENFGYVGYDGGNKQYRSTTYNFANNAVNCFGDYTFTVEHDNDGTKSLTLEGAWATSHSAYISGGSVSGAVTLETIPRASSISGAGDVVLGNACSIQWTPNSSSFRYKLTFSLGGWTHTTAAIHPNKTSVHTYTGYTIPLDEVAAQIPGDDESTMKVTLTTYSDSACTTSIGSDGDEFKVTVPDTDKTRPVVTMTLTPDTPLDDLYIQGVSRVQAEISAAAQLGAAIESYSMTVGGYTFTGQSPLSSYLTASGQIEITGCAVDSRGIPGYAKQTITVHPYFRPRLTNVEAYRCTSDGVAADDGEYLKIKVTRNYAPVTVDGEQKNFCTVRYRYKAENAGTYSYAFTILDAAAEGDTVTTAPMLNAGLRKDTAYTVQILVIDTVGQSGIVTVSIPSEYVFRHKRSGGKGLGLGGYCDEDDLLDVHWNIRGRKAINGMYIQRAEVNAESNTITIRWKHAINAEQESPYQTLFLFGVCETILVFGEILIVSSAVKWSGQPTTVTGTMNSSTGTAVVTLPGARKHPFMIMSADEFEIVE